MPSFNRTLSAGHLTRDPESRAVGQSTVCNFGLAMNRKYKGNDGEKKEEVTFVDIECWGRTAELCVQYLSKGRAVLIEGRLKLDEWEDKDGNRRSKLKIVAEAVQFLDGGGQRGGSQQSSAGQQYGSNDDDAPF